MQMQINKQFSRKPKDGRRIICNVKKEEILFICLLHQSTHLASVDGKRSHVKRVRPVGPPCHMPRGHHPLLSEKAALRGRRARRSKGGSMH